MNDYWRYWWGSAYLTAAILDFDDVSLATYKSTLKIGTYLAILLLSAVAALRYRAVGLAMIPLTAALAFGFAIPLFGRSIAFEPGLLLGLLLLLVYMLAGIDRAPIHWNAACAAVIGGLTYYFDLLDGNVSAIMIILVALYICANRTFGHPRRPLDTRMSWPLSIGSIVLMISYTLGAVYAALLRIAVRAAVLRQNPIETTTEWYQALANRVQNSVPEYNAFDFGPIYLLKRLYYKIDYAMFPYLGRMGTMLVYAACGITYIACLISVIRNVRRQDLKALDPFAAILMTAATVPAWFIVFANHTAIHSFMTGRLLSLFFALACSLAVLLWDYRFKCTS